MIKTGLTALAIAATCSLMAQNKYVVYSTTDSVDVATKWSTAKDENGVKMPALLLSLDNYNEHAVNVNLEILLYYEGILRERGEITGQCIEGRKKLIGKLNGLYFIPQEFTAEQLKQPDFLMEIDEIEVNETEGCE
jgi:hypothetical protein